MGNNMFSKLWQEATETADRTKYISAWSLSPIWGDPEDSAEIPQDRVDLLGRIWDAAHRDYKEIRRLSGLTQQQIFQRYLIPIPTQSQWSTGHRNPPPYVLLLLQEALGLLEIPHD